MTKPDLSRQAIIPSGSTASFDGSINIGEKLLVQDVEFVISGITSGQTLVYDSNLNKLIPTSIDIDASSRLASMSDVNFTSLVSGDTIVYNSATNKWENNNITLNTDSVINTSTVTGSTTTNALDNLNINKADIVDINKICPDLVLLASGTSYTASYSEAIYVDSDAIGINFTIILPNDLKYGGVVYVKNISSPSTYSVSVDAFVVTGGDWIIFRKGLFGGWEVMSSSLSINTTVSASDDWHTLNASTIFQLLGNKADLVGGKVPSSQLPSYVDDVIEGYYYTSVFYEDSGHTISISGETSKIYIDLPTNFSYRWSGSVYIQISSTVLSGTPNRITVTTGDTIDIASNYSGQTSINTVGGITTGSWSGTPINDTYISSASIWNAKPDSYTIPNYYKVNFNTGSNVTGVAGRSDKPFATLQYVWDLIVNNNTTDILIEIEGDYVATTHAIYETTFSKHNITFTFLNDVTYSVNSTTTSRPLFSFNIACNNLTFNVPSYTMTKQGGFCYNAVGTNNIFNFTNITALQGVNTSTVNNFGFIQGTSTGLVSCQNLNISLTNDSNNIKGYEYFFNCAGMSYDIDNVVLTGAPTVASTQFTLFYGAIAYLKSNRITYSPSSYTNISQLFITYAVSGTLEAVFNNVKISVNGSTIKNYELFHGSCDTLTINSAEILNYQHIFSNGFKVVNLGETTLTGVINKQTIYFTGILNLKGNITKTVANQANYSMISLGNGGSINGNGFMIKHNDASYISTSAVIILYGDSATPKLFRINNLFIYNSGMVADANPTYKPVFYYWTFPIKLVVNNLISSSNTDSNTNANTTWLYPYGGSSGYVINVEGTVFTNYSKALFTADITNNTETNIITNYIG